MRPKISSLWLLMACFWPGCQLCICVRLRHPWLILCPRFSSAISRPIFVSDEWSLKCMVQKACYAMLRLPSCVWLCATPWTVARQAPLSMGIFQARILEWVAMPSSRGSSKPRSPTLQADSLLSEPPGKPKNTGVGSLSLLQGNFVTQESNQGLLHCRRILY